MIERSGPRRLAPGAGLTKVQLRLATELTFEQYVTARAWRWATLSRCPLCSSGQCRLERHGTYMRKVPAVAYVTRYWCPRQRTSFGLLPDFYASRMPGTLDDLQAVAALGEQTTVEAAAEALRPGDVDDAITLPCAVRWVRRRQKRVRAMLVAVMGLLPALFSDCRATVASFRARLETATVLVALRGICQVHLHALPRPLGLVPPPDRRRWQLWRIQQSMGPDPPRLRR